MRKHEGDTATCTEFLPSDILSISTLTVEKKILKNLNQKAVIILYLWADKGFHALTPDLNSFYTGCCNLISYTRSLYWLRGSAVTENGKGSAWEMRVNGESALWAVKEKGDKRMGRRVEEKGGNKVSEILEP